MREIWIVLLLCAIVLAFCGTVCVAYLAWRKMGPRGRIASVLLLVPHFLLVVCIVVGLACGQAPQGSRCFNAQFFCGVLMLFILPLPALVGTVAALTLFIHARFGSHSLITETISEKIQSPNLDP